MTDRSLILTAPAKINLYLGVHTERDARGYHSRFPDGSRRSSRCRDGHAGAGVDRPDGSGIRFSHAKKYGLSGGNRYGRALRSRCNVCVTIEKRIPLCAGLGGPSTDAAAVIVALAELWGIDRADPALDDIARGIGADVPFFLHTSPALYVGGGDVLATEYPVLPATPVVLVKPHETSVSTVEAYRRFDESPVPAEKPDAIASVLRAGDAEAAYALVHNNLASYPRRWSRGSRRFSTGCAHRREPLPWTCAVRVPARLPFVIPSLQQPILRELPSKMLVGLHD